MKKIIPILTILILICLFIGLGYIVYTKYFTENKDIVEIQKVADDYFAQNQMYGFTTKENEELNCFSKNTFFRNPTIANILAQSNTDSISCKFKIENNKATSWSVFLIKGDTVYCGDSFGNNMLTPGITTTSNCNAN